MTITFPDEMRAELEAEAKAGGFGSVDEYVLIMYHRAKHSFGVNGENEIGDDSEAHPDGPLWERPGVRERLLALAEEGLASGPGVPVTPEFWADLRRQAGERIAAREPTP